MSEPAFVARAEPRGFVPDGRFSLFEPQAPTPAPVADPVEEAFARGHAQGFAEGVRSAEQVASEREAARGRIELAFARMDEQAMRNLRERLRQTVLGLCEEAVAPLAIDADGLCRRIERACALLQRAQDERRIHLHPQDLALIEGRLPLGLTLEPDPQIERGALRIETPDGGVEDGPGRWRAILAEAFREC